MERQRRRSGDADEMICASVYKALKTCKTKLTLLDGVVQKAKIASDGKHTVARSFGSLKLACRNKDIKEFETQLQHAVSALDLTMTMNLTAIQSLTRDEILQISTTINDQVTLLHPEFRSSPVNIQNNSKIKSVATGKPRHATDFGKLHLLSRRKYSTPFGTVYMLRRRRPSNEPQYRNFGTLDIRFIPSFISRCVEVQYSNSFGVIEAAIRTHPVIPWRHSAFDMCRTGDILGLQEYFSTGSLSPYSINKYGVSFLHIAMENHNDKVCEMLFHLGLNSNVTDEFGWRPAQLLKWTPSMPSASFQSEGFKNCCRLLETYSDDISEGRLELMGECYNPRFAEFLMDFCIADTTYLTEDLQLGRSLIRKLIGVGASIHHRNSEGRSILNRLMTHMDDALDSIYLGKFWLDALSQAGIDTCKYLQIEIVMSHETPFFFPHEDNRVLHYTLDPPSIFWDWYYDPQGAAYDVLKEFKHFNMARMAEKTLTETWPFNFPYWQLFGKEDERFKHQQRKKTTRLARTKYLRKGPRMAGAWID